ncbi:1409_t:CDS:2 [Racocetra persica]|uniref:1409_t:CDS:1 n=1 Tax=Racocetra persica TaxID=160502 RepID=A0ACA9R4N5_9GLOM|nr:1409_t:CDS:2 [Racocetra persica]
MSQQRNNAKLALILEQSLNTTSDSSEISQDLLNFGNQSPIIQENSLKNQFWGYETN